MRLLLFVLIGFSITNAVVFLHVFAWLRSVISGLSDNEFEFASHKGTLEGFRQKVLGRLFRCHACTGFWVGGFLSASLGGFISEYVELSFTFDVVGSGLLLSCTNFIIWVVLRKLGAEEL